LREPTEEHIEEQKTRRIREARNRAIDREQRRRNRIMRFVERQLTVREWIAFVDLADWCAQSTTAAGIDEEKKAKDLAYRRLADAIINGEFERDGRSKILYLDTLVPRCRLTIGQFRIAFGARATPPYPPPPLAVLNCCWLPRELAQKWLESHGYRWPEHFEPASSHAPPLANVVKAPGPLASSRTKHYPPTRERPFWPAARDVAREWLTENGCPAPNDGNQAALEKHVTEWVENRGYEASESAIRRHVVRWIKEFRQELEGSLGSLASQ
jgi:hypothetical protein